MYLNGTWIRSVIAAAQSGTTTWEAIAPEMTLVLLGIVFLLFLAVFRLVSILRRMRRFQSYLVESLAAQQTKTGAESELLETEPEPAADEMEDQKVTLGRLVVLRGLNERVIPLSCETFVIGRSGEDECTYAVDRPYISPQHCQLTFRDGRFLIKDLGSKNGTFVNGERLPREREVVVPIGSEIEITKNIAFELWDPNTILDLEKIDSSHVHDSTIYEDDDLSFQAMPGIAYVEDDDEIAEDYSPV